MRVAIIGAGRIGCAVHELMNDIFGGGGVSIFDSDGTKVNMRNSVMHLLDPEKQLKHYDIWIVATPFFANKQYIELAAHMGKIYIDFTEDVEVRKFAEELAKGGGGEHGAKLIPQCGLAPGLVNAVAHGLALTLDDVYSINVRVGALPQASMHPSRYAITWSAEGVINEYLNPCETLVNGRKVMQDGMSGYERLVINGVEYEAFRTSGGAGTLVDTWSGHPETSIEYKTLRYPGHLGYMKESFASWRWAGINTIEDISKLLKTEIPTTTKDKIVIYIEVTGTKNEEYVSKSFVEEFLPAKGLTAIQISTALGALVWCSNFFHFGTNFMEGTLLKQEDMDSLVFVKTMMGLYENIYGKKMNAALPDFRR